MNHLLFAVNEGLILIEEIISYEGIEGIEGDDGHWFSDKGMFAYSDIRLALVFHSRPRSFNCHLEGVWLVECFIHQQEKIAIVCLRSLRSLGRDS